MSNEEENEVKKEISEAELELEERGDREKE